MEKKPISQMRAEFIKRLRCLLDERGVTQTQLAAAVGVSGAAVSNWLSGAAPRVEELEKIAEFFQVPLHVLLGTPEREPDSNFFFDEEQKQVLAVLVNGMSKTTEQGAMLVQHGCILPETLTEEIFREHTRVPDGAALVRVFRPAHVGAPLNALLEFPSGALQHVTLNGPMTPPTPGEEEAGR